MKRDWIDAHTHLVPYREVSGYSRGITAAELIAAMDAWGIAKAVVLPLESPECDSEYALTAQTFELCEQYPDRLLPFVGVDPRSQRGEQKVRRYAARGARGFGEHKCGLAIDDPRSMRMYELCGELGLPVLFHMDPDLCWDEAGLPRLERVLKTFPDTIFIAHGPAWWSAISADDDRKGGYPEGPVKQGGAADRLLAEYSNLYADISAGSGYNALTRDPKFTEGFLERHWRKLLLGTDYFHVSREIPQVDWLRSYPMPEQWREAIGHRNAEVILSR